MPDILYLDNVKDMRCACGKDDCPHDGLILHARCHMESPTWAELNAIKGTLTIRCAECDKEVAVFAISRKENLS